VNKGNNKITELRIICTKFTFHMHMRMQTKVSHLWRE
jgi:hypothetical protein